MKESSRGLMTATPGIFESVVDTRHAGTWAEAEGLSPDAIEKMYSGLVNHAITEELKHCGPSTRHLSLVSGLSAMDRSQPFATGNNRPKTARQVCL